MYRQSAFGRIPPKKQSEISVPENYSGNAFRDGDPPLAMEEAEIVPVSDVTPIREEQNTAEPSSFLSGITEKLSGDSLLLLLVMFIVLGGGGEREDGTLLSLLVLLLL